MGCVAYRPHQLRGGTRKRVWLAATILYEPEVVLTASPGRVNDLKDKGQAGHERSGREPGR